MANIIPYNKTIFSVFQIITIEALADKCENAEHGNQEKKDPMLFLHEKEQEKVGKFFHSTKRLEKQKLVCKQTVTPCKDVAIQNDEEKSKCACHHMLLERV